MTRNPQLRSSLVVVATLLLSGCGSLLGGGDHPATLYRFGGTAASTAAPESSAPMPIRSVSFRGATLPVESRGDRILTVRGTTAAYVADARWIAPASELFDSRMRSEFTRAQPGVRLLRPTEGSRAEFVLVIDVQRFEAIYEGAEIPIVVMEADAKLMRWSDRALIREWSFSSRKPAAENRVSSIVAAYDEATNDIAGDVAGTVGNFLASVPASVS